MKRGNLEPRKKITRAQNSVTLVTSITKNVLECGISATATRAIYRTTDTIPHEWAYCFFIEAYNASSNTSIRFWRRTRVDSTPVYNHHLRNTVAARRRAGNDSYGIRYMSSDVKLINQKFFRNSLFLILKYPIGGLVLKLKILQKV